MAALIAFLKTDLGVAILAAVILIDHALAGSDKFKSNATLQAVFGAVDKLIGLLKNFLFPPADSAPKA